MHTGEQSLFPAPASLSQDTGRQKGLSSQRLHTPAHTHTHIHARTHTHIHTRARACARAHTQTHTQKQTLTNTPPQPPQPEAPIYKPWMFLIF